MPLGVPIAPIHEAKKRYVRAASLRGDVAKGVRFRPPPGGASVQREVLCQELGLIEKLRKASSQEVQMANFQGLLAANGPTRFRSPLDRPEDAIGWLRGPRLPDGSCVLTGAFWVLTCHWSSQVYRISMSWRM